jgi:hypothetical protein
MPVLLIHSLQDHVVPPSASARSTRDSAARSSSSKELERSFTSRRSTTSDEIERRAVEFAAQVSRRRRG